MVGIISIAIIAIAIVVFFLWPTGKTGRAQKDESFVARWSPGLAVFVRQTFDSENTTGAEVVVSTMEPSPELKWLHEDYKSGNVSPDDFLSKIGTIPLCEPGKVYKTLSLQEWEEVLRLRRENNSALLNKMICLDEIFAAYSKHLKSLPA